MIPRSTVETPHRFKAVGLNTADSASTRGDPDEVVPRGVSTEGPVLFKGRLRVQSTRLQGWDYRSNGYYFVTICCRDRAPFLGDIIDGRVLLSKAGEIVTAEWKGIALRRRDVFLDEWVVMPNHVHGILVIARDPGVETPQRIGAPGRLAEDSRSTQSGRDEGMQRGVSVGRPEFPDRGVETPLRIGPSDRPAEGRTSAQRTRDEEMQRGVSTASRLQAGSVGAIIGQFKSRSTKRVWQAGLRNFGWQPRFYDHIIRDDRSLDDIRQYVIDNPAMWDSQVAIPENLWM